MAGGKEWKEKSKVKEQTEKERKETTWVLKNKRIKKQTKERTQRWKTGRKKEGDRQEEEEESSFSFPKGNVALILINMWCYYQGTTHCAGDLSFFSQTFTHSFICLCLFLSASTSVCFSGYFSVGLSVCHFWACETFNSLWWLTCYDSTLSGSTRSEVFPGHVWVMIKLLTELSGPTDKHSGGHAVWRFQSSVPPSPYLWQQCVEASWRLKALHRFTPWTWIITPLQSLVLFSTM